MAKLLPCKPKIQEPVRIELTPEEYNIILEGGEIPLERLGLPPIIVSCGDLDPVDCTVMSPNISAKEYPFVDNHIQQ